MKRTWMLWVSAALLAGSVILGIRPCAAAADWSLSHSWRWPLYVRVEDGGQVKTGEPRPAVWTSTAEFQNYGNIYLHPGFDIRGDYGDPVLVPTDGTVERVYNYTNHCLITGTHCRAWFKTDDARFLYYVSHIDLAPTPAPGGRQVTTEIREKIQNAVNGIGDRTVSVGQKMATLTIFTTSNWHHLHLGIFDRLDRYALKDATYYFEQQPTGETGPSLLIMDDEAPQIRKMELVRDQTSTNAVTTGICGNEVWGRIDIVADIQDTFFTNGNFASFPGKGSLPPSTGIRTARYFVRSVATGAIVDEGTWYDLATTPLTCSNSATTGRACLLEGVTYDDNGFFAQMNNELGAPAAGLTVLDKLFDVWRSNSDYDSSETYWHILTNAAGAERAWDTTGLSNGRYQVSIEATDFAGNQAARSMFVTVHDPATPLDLTARGFGDIYVRDHGNDNGAVPSNLGGQPYWESPDIILVPHGMAVTVDTPAVQDIVVAGGQFDVYVRITNDGCNPISGVKARVYSSNPSAANVTWNPITPANQYVGDEHNPGGVTVGAGLKALLGPFLWEPTVEDAQYGGHRCLLAAVDSPNDPGPTSLPFDVPNQNNVGQRNLQVTNCIFQLPNSTTQDAQLGLIISTDADVNDPATVVKVVMDFDASWLAAWSGRPEIQATEDGGKLVVRLLLQNVTLPTVVFPGSASRILSFQIDLPAGTSTRTVSVQPVINGAPVQGVSCSDVGAPIIY